MPTPIRNSCVARGKLSTASYITVYTVPAGYVLLLKSIYLQTYGGAGATKIASVFDPVSTASGLLYNGPSVTSQVFNWEGWVAMNPGDQLLMLASPAPTNYWVSGALLPFQARLPI